METEQTLIAGTDEYAPVSLGDIQHQNMQAVLREARRQAPAKMVQSRVGRTIGQAGMGSDTCSVGSCHGGAEAKVGQGVRASIVWQSDESVTPD